MTNRVRSIRRAFLVSASFPAAAVLGMSSAAAQQTVTVAQPATTADVNARIATATATPSRDVKVDVTAAGVVTGGGAVTVQPADGRGDGTVVFVNAGRIGALDAAGAAVTDNVAVILRGANSKGDNSVSLTNSGLITGGVQIGAGTPVGGTGTFSNAATGQIFNGVTVFAVGDVKIDTAAGSTVSSGNVVGNAVRTTKSDTKDGVTTNTTTGGASTINIAGDVQSKDGTVRGAVSGTGVSASTVNVAGNVGAVTATATGARTFTGLAAAPAAEAGKTITTVNQTDTFGAGAASVTVSGKATSATATGQTSATVVVNGAVAGNVTATIPFATNTTQVATQTLDANKAVVATSVNQSTKAVGAGASVTVAQGGSVGSLDTQGNILASGVTSASVTNQGTVIGNLVARTTVAPTESSFVEARAFDAKGALTSLTSKQVSSFVGGEASVTVGAGAVVGGQKDGVTVSGGDVTAQAQVGKATVTNAGAVRGNVSATSSATTTTTVNSFKSETLASPAAVRTTNSSVVTRDVAGSTASLANATTGNIAGNVFVSGDAGAALTNAGTIGRPNTGQATTVNSRRFVDVLTQSDQIATNAADGLSSSFDNSFKNVNRVVGGAVALENSATGVLSGNISLNGAGDISIVNAGAVRGTTTATTSGATTETTNSSVGSIVTTPGKAPVLDVTATSTKNASSTTITNTAGSIVGTYSGSNGSLNFAPIVDGSISQNAAKDSSLTVSGTVFGAVNSAAGNGVNQTSSTTELTETRLDTAGTGTRTREATSQFKSTQVAGTSAVTVSGAVNDSTVSSASVQSTGNNKASAAISGRVEGNVGVSANGVTTSTNANQLSLSQQDTRGVTRTLSVSEGNQNSFSRTGGSASAELSGKAVVLGSVNVNGNTDASAVVGSTAAIGSTTVTGNLIVTAGAVVDTTSSTSSKYTFDTKTSRGSSTTTTTSVSTPSAPAAVASAKVDGKVFGTTNVNAAGNASVVLTGVSTNGVNASAGATKTETTSTLTQAGVSAQPAATTFGGATTGLTNATRSFTSTTTQSLGKASVSVASNAELVAAGTPAVTNGAVSANGAGGATVSIAQGSIVNNNVFANAVRFDSSNTINETFTQDPTSVDASGQPLTLDSKTVSTPVGSVAGIVNNGTVTGTLQSFGLTGATVENSGKAGSAVAIAATTATTTTVAGTNLSNPALQRQVETATSSTVGGAASVTNKAGGVLGGITVAGVTGSAVNNGVVTGTIQAGTSFQDFTVTTTRTSVSTVQDVTQPTKRPTQTYTIDQNAIARGISVGGATTTVSLADGSSRVLTTSDVAATVNLNKGSLTLGPIVGETDVKTGARLTNTTVNLNDAGFLGADTIVFGNVAPNALTGAATPIATVPEKIAPLLGFADNSIASVSTRVLGVTTLNKTGAGTFVINGTPYVAPTSAGTKAAWTVEAATLNNKAGELQLTVPGDFGVVRPEFGILGNVNNDASLVLGRRVPSRIAAVGDSLVNNGPETIDGIIVRQQGNFVQSATGSLVVGVTPSLVRFSPVAVGTAGNAPEPLGPVAAGVNIPFFTTAQRLGISNQTSGLNITGDLNLAGTVRLNVTRDSLFTNGDGYTLITYTGNGTVTATAVPTLASRFVSFGLVHDTAAKTVALRATRTSYATGATDPNSVRAATALDSALTAAVTAIRTDAAGGAGFQTVSQIGFAQDVANVATALDYRLTADQAAQLFRELSSGEIYGSLSSLNQNVAFGETMNMLAVRRAQGGELGTSIWGAPIGSFARYGGLASGASRIEATSYGASFGIDLAYSPNGVIGFGGAYAEHDVNAQGTAEQADATTWTIGTYVHQRFDQFYANALFAYGFTRFDVERNLTLLSRNIQSDFRGKQLDASLEVGYDFELGQAAVTPYGKLALRRVSFNGITEENGGGLGLTVDGFSKSIFSPTVGVRIGGEFAPNDTITVRPFIRGAFTFQGDVGASRGVGYRAGGDRFILTGVRPDDFGSIDLGVDTNLGSGLNLFVNGGYSFGGGNKVTSIRGGLNFRF